VGPFLKLGPITRVLGVGREAPHFISGIPHSEGLTLLSKGNELVSIHYIY